MGLVRKAATENSDTENVAEGKGGADAMSSLIRQAVTDEIERQRQESLRPVTKRAPLENEADSDDG